MDTFRLLELIFIRSVHKTAGPRQFYGHIDKTGGPRQFQASSKNPLKTTDLSSFMDPFRLSVKSVYKTVGPRQFCGHIEKLVDLGTSMDTEFQVSQNCQGPTVLWTLLTDNRKVSIKLLRSAVFKGFFLLGWKSVHRTA